MRAIVVVIGLGLVMPLAGCAAEGDFGRRQPGAIVDVVLPFAGKQISRLGGGAVSDFMLTDDEREWRARAWRFLMPAHSKRDFELSLGWLRTRLESTVAELRIARIVPAGFLPPGRDLYFASLTGGEWRSSQPPYRRLVNDMQADTELIELLEAIEKRVLARDAVRKAGLEKIADLTPGERQQALARIAENEALALWIDAALQQRVDGYRYALERLFIEIPERDAVTAERMLAILTARVGSDPVAAPTVQRATARKRYTPGLEDEDVPQK